MTATGQLILNWKCYKVFKMEMELHMMNIFNIRGIANARTNRKDNIFMQRRLVQNFTFILEWGQGTCSLTHGAGHIPGIFSLNAAYSAFLNIRIPPEIENYLVLVGGLAKNVYRKSLQIVFLLGKMG